MTRGPKSYECGKCGNEMMRKVSGFIYPNKDPYEKIYCPFCYTEHRNDHECHAAKEHRAD